MARESYLKKLKVGDLVTSGWKGYWVIEEIERRYYTELDIRYWPNKEEGEEYASLLSIRQVACDNFKPRKGKVIKLHDETGCKKIDAEALIDGETETQTNRWDNLFDMIKEYISKENQ